MAKANDKKQPLYITFGNHMHWVDMQWLWGYHVLPGSVRDMLHLIKQTGAKGNVNFDGIGYEKMAAECPEALADLRAAIKRGDVEPVGCSYGQPYGLFQGGESNIRQFTYGVRSVQRLFGVRPRAFWEEEFYFFPQLPQVLDQCGFTGACLYFQWTWHTPEIPKEPTSLVLWEGIDGTRLPCLPRNDLNLHQWPEDFDGVLDKVAAMPADGAPPAIVQWLELMPSKDWMCRSEVLLPRLKELMGDKRFDVQPRTVSGLIKELAKPARTRGSHPDIPVRHYTMDNVWHGMTLGKNGDRHPRASAEVERDVLAAEAISATLSLFGRPYPSWDVYPTWELDEAWRSLLAAQHHDNHECEGLCGFVAYEQMRTASSTASEVRHRALQMLSDRLDSPAALNIHGFDREVRSWRPSSKRVQTARIPAFGYAAAGQGKPAGNRATVHRTGSVIRLRRNGTEVLIDAKRGVITQLTTRDFPRGVLSKEMPFGELERVVNGRRRGLPPVQEVQVDDDVVTIWFKVDQTLSAAQRKEWSNPCMFFRISIPHDVDGVDLHIHSLGNLARPDAGYGGAIRMPIAPGWTIERIRADTPYAASEVEGGPPARRKYPEGDWMTSPQWFEEVARGITASRFIDLQAADASGLLVLHNGSQQFFRTARAVDAILCAYDPWDEQRYEPGMFDSASFRLVPHCGMGDADRARLAATFSHDAKYDVEYIERHPHFPPVGGGTPDHPDLPPTFGPLEVTNAPNVLAHAFFRESMKSGEHLPSWAGHRMLAESDGVCDHPFVVRLVEWNGEPARVRLKLAGKVALAAKTNLLGEVATDRRSGGATKGVGASTGWLRVKHPVAPPWWGKIDGKPIKFRGKPITWSEVEFDMRPREIATIYADMVMGRKEFRDLDAKRKVWATIHKKK